MKSQLHPKCSPACPGHRNHPQSQRYVEPTPADWTEWADQLWVRYSKNAAARAAIPAEYLSPAYRTAAGDEEAAVNQEDEQQEDAGPDLNAGIAGPFDPSLRFAAVGRLLVDRGVSPACLPPRMRGTPAPPDSASAHIVETPWVNPTHFSGTCFFTDPVIVAFVEDPTRQTTKSNAQRHDSWMCSNLNISDTWHTRFMQHFPKLAFGPTDSPQRFWWEWVS